MVAAFRFAVVLALLIVWLLGISGVHSQDTPWIYSLHIRSDIQFRFATTLITSRLANPANASKAAVFRVTLPDEAFISNFTLEINGVVYPGYVKEKEEAKREYDSAKKRGQSAGHVSQSPRDTRVFKVEVNVAALSKVTFNLTYQEILQRKRGFYQHKIYVNPGQPVDDLSINVAIQESREITMLRVPPIRNDLITATGLQEEQNPLAVITRRDPKSALVSYVPNVEQQTETSSDGLSGQFIVDYEVDRSLDAGDLLVVDGYFVHFIAPEVEEDIPKDILFILDTSGSMNGKKIGQLKEAMDVILSDMQPEDRFNIIEFGSSVEDKYGGFIEANHGNILKAKRDVDKLRASGGTNINKALRKGIALYVEGYGIEDHETRSPMILFLTDGRATDGITDTNTILENVKTTNAKPKSEIPINSLAFGEGADWNLIRKVAFQNNGVAKKIYEASDAALQITGFYSEVSNTALRNVSVQYLGETVDRESLTKSEFSSFFGGSELIVSGKLSDRDTSLRLNVLGTGAVGDLVLALDPDKNVVDMSKVAGLMGEEDFATITEKMWAYMTIKEYLERIGSGSLDASSLAELKKKAVDLSLKYNFVTQLTSLVVTKPDDEKSAESLQKGGDPHYKVRIYGLDHPICFDFDSGKEEFYQLIHDPVRDISINVATIVSDMHKKNGDPRTYIGEVGLRTGHHTIVVTPDAIIFDKKVIPWEDEQTYHFGSNDFSVIDKVNGTTTMSFRFNFGAVMYVQCHTRHTHGLLDYLNVYVSGEDRFSTKTVGLIGQFVNGQKHVIKKKSFANKSDKGIAMLQVREGPKLHETATNGTTGGKTHHRIRATLDYRPGVIRGEKEKCWMVHKKFVDLLVGPHSDFVLPILLPFPEVVN